MLPQFVQAGSQCHLDSVDSALLEDLQRRVAAGNIDGFMFDELESVLLQQLCTTVLPSLMKVPQLQHILQCAPTHTHESGVNHPPASPIQTRLDESAHALTQPADPAPVTAL